MMQMPVSSQIPRGVGCPPPPGMDPRKGKGKLMCIKVRMLDDTVGVFHLGHKALGQALFDEVCRHLNLLESDYFGLEFIDSYGNRCWLDKEKSILRQIMAAQSDARFFFIIKFYTPNPAELEEEYTRYLFALQLRRDLARGELVCNENTAAMLVSYIVQSECGDFSSLDYPDHTYLSATQFVPNQSPTFQLKVMELHKKLVGMTPAEADFNLLETARRCDFYGIRLHNARDLEGIEVALSVAHMGIKVFHHLNCVTTFSWAKVRKLSFKRKRLMIKIHPDSNQQYKETIEFLFENRDDCKNFWKKSVEHHSFFRCPEPAESKHHHHDSSRRLFHRGSHFHYQGRTQKQLIDYVREHRKRREPFERPLRRSAGPTTVNSTLRNAALHQQCAQQQQQRALFVTDRMAGEYMLDGIAGPNSATDKHLVMANFPSICHQQPKQNGRMMAINGAVGNGTKKLRPQSVLLDTTSIHPRQPHQGKGQNGQQQQQCDHPMQQSCHGAIPNGGGITTNMHHHHHHQEQLQQQQQDAFAAFHEQMDPMSMSLPNVLAPTALQTDHCCFYAPLKSMSGENFHVMEQHRRGEIDNQSEGSYRIGADPNGPGLNSSQSDVGSASTAPAGPVDPRVYQTTFTTKRVGNVIVKKITSATSSAGVSASTSRPNRQPVGKPLSPPPSSAPVPVRPPPLDGLGSGCSSACCSDYSIASSSAPTSARSIGDAGRRLRYAPISGGAAGLAGRLRHEIPVAIDGPPIKMGTGLSSSADGTPLIIRPVLLPSPPGHRRFSSSASTSANSTPTQATAIGGGGGGGRRPLVLKTQSTDFGDIGNGAGNREAGTSRATIIVPITRVNIAAGIQQSPKMGAEPKSGTGGNGPMPGRVIRKEDLVITPNGIGLKNTAKEREEEGEKLGRAVEMGTKPKVPPKPDLQSLNLPSSFGPKVAPEGDNSNKGEEESERRALLDPLESILRDVQAINEAIAGGGGGGAQKQRAMPTAIAIQSEERPDLKTVHLFNGGGGGEGGRGGETVPYTLTVRDVSGQQRAASKEDAAGRGDGQTKQQPGRCEHSSRHGKSIELVHRRRLPSQDSYSSQDHSISPTSPDSGNVLEYVLRKRSQSSDRAVQGQQQTPQQKSTIGKGRRSAERRMTQPVELGGGMGAGEKNVAKKNEDGEENSNKPTDEPAQKPSNTPQRAEGAAPEEVKQLLETDF